MERKIGIAFDKRKRFDKRGIFGDLYDERKTELGSTVNYDKVSFAADNVVKPRRVMDTRTFDKYVVRDITAFESVAGTKLASNILSDE